MTRIIIFRAWDSVKKQMKEDVIVGQGKNWFINKTSTWFDIAGFDNKPILMQYTGLKDKNGTEIYDGDIIWAGLFDQHSGKKLIGAIVYDDKLRLRSNSNWYFSGFTIKKYNSVADFDNENRWEVIGNIYENPELLTT